MDKQKLLETALIACDKKDLGLINDSVHEAEIEFYDDGGTVIISVIQTDETGKEYHVVMSMFNDNGDMIADDDHFARSDDEIICAVKILVANIPEIEPTWKSFGLRDL